MKKQLYVLVALIMAASMFLSACGAAATTAAPATQAPVQRRLHLLRRLPPRLSPRPPLYSFS